MQSNDRNLKDALASAKRLRSRFFYYGLVIVSAVATGLFGITLGCGFADSTCDGWASKTNSWIAGIGAMIILLITPSMLRGIAKSDNDNADREIQRKMANVPNYAPPSADLDDPAPAYVEIVGDEQIPLVQNGV